MPPLRLRRITVSTPAFHVGNAGFNSPPPPEPEDDVAQETVHDVFSKSMDGTRPQILTGDTEGWPSWSKTPRLKRDVSERAPGVRIPRLPICPGSSGVEHCPLLILEQQDKAERHRF